MTIPFPKNDPTRDEMIAQAAKRFSIPEDEVRKIWDKDRLIQVAGTIEEFLRFQKEISLTDYMRERHQMNELEMRSLALLVKTCEMFGQMGFGYVVLIAMFSMGYEAAKLPIPEDPEDPTPPEDDPPAAA